MRDTIPPYNTIREAVLKPTLKKRLAMFPLVLALLVLVTFYYLNTTPASFKTGATFSIPEGSGVGTIGELLENNGYIRSALLFKILIKAQYGSPLILAGDYEFNEPLKLHALTETLITGESRRKARAMTFPEGFSIYDVREYTGDAFTVIDLEEVSAYEGYLFPETYFIDSHETFNDLEKRMRDEYEKNIAPLRETIAQSGFSESEVIILASILEREANDEISMRTVSGILQNRLKDDIPLQVDAVFEYILGKTSEELTLDDLALESPYNTYLYTGLPPAPIANPGLMAINAVLDPIPSEYYYYLTGNDGVFRYAKDFEGHKQNKAKYLR